MIVYQLLDVICSYFSNCNRYFFWQIKDEISVENHKSSKTITKHLAQKFNAPALQTKVLPKPFAGNKLITEVLS